jgi:hypothetical protein
MSVREPPVPWTGAVLDLLRDWERRAAASSEAHYALYAVLRTRHDLIGVSAVILTTLLSTSIVDSLQEQLDLALRIAIDFAIVIAGGLAALQIFLRYDSRADEQREAAETWAGIRREIGDVLRLEPGRLPRSYGDPKDYVDRLRARMDDAAAASPEVGDRAWAQATKGFGRSPRRALRRAR